MAQRLSSTQAARQLYSICDTIRKGMYVCSVRAWHPFGGEPGGSRLGGRTDSPGTSTRYQGYRRVTLQRLQGRVTLQTHSDNACDRTASTSVAQTPDQGAGHLPELSVPHSS